MLPTIQETAACDRVRDIAAIITPADAEREPRLRRYPNGSAQVSADIDNIRFPVALTAARKGKAGTCATWRLVRAAPDRTALARSGSRPCSEAS